MFENLHADTTPSSVEATSLKATIPRILVREWNPARYREIDRGGEAVIYKLSPAVVAKVFHTPFGDEFKDNHPFREAAKVRLLEMQEKLPAFPTDMPQSVVSPTGILVTPADSVFGYVMPFVNGVVLGKETRTAATTLSYAQRLRLILDIYEEIESIHEHAVIGDLNESNLMLADDKPRFIDADAMQYGGWMCKAFTPRFTDPSILDITRNRMTGIDEYALAKPHSELSDWYSFLVIAMRLLVHTDPYGGVAEGMDLGERIKNRVTIFDAHRVKYPRTAKPLASIPRPLVELFWRVFQNGERSKPPRELFESLCGVKRKPKIPGIFSSTAAFIRSSTSLTEPKGEAQ